MTFTKEDLTRIKNFHYTPDYHLLEMIVNSLIEESQRQSSVMDSEWDTIKATLLSEGEQRGLARLMQRLGTLASQSQ